MTKDQLRKRVQRTLRSLDAEAIRTKSAAIAATLFRTAWWQKARVVLAFMPISGEADTGPIIARALEERKVVAIPRVEGSHMRFCRYTGSPAELRAGVFGIQEPTTSCEPLDLSGGDSGPILVITPGLAFDRCGRRLGRGRAYYDRFLARLRQDAGGDTVAVGICFAEQVFEEVPCDPHDVLLDGLIVEGKLVVPSP